MFNLFVFSLIVLFCATISAFCAAFRTRSLILIIFIPLIAISGSISYFSFKSVLGYPCSMLWSQLPDRISVIYFKIEKEKSITLWLNENKTTKLIQLPYIELAKKTLEQHRQTMGRGIPVNLRRDKTVSGSGKPGGKGKGRGKGKGGGKRGGNKKGHGWNYIVESRGVFIPMGTLPPK